MDDIMETIFTAILVIGLSVFIITNQRTYQNDIQNITQEYNISNEQARMIYNEIRQNDFIIQYDKDKAINKYDGRLYTAILHESINANRFNHDYIEWKETGEYDYELLEIIQYTDNLINKNKTQDYSWVFFFIFSKK